LDHNVGVVISNGKIDKGILNIMDGKNVGTFFTNTPHSTVPVDMQAMKGKSTDPIDVAGTTAAIF
jgi:glutamate 5-kinase